MEGVINNRRNWMVLKIIIKIGHIDFLPLSYFEPRMLYGGAIWQVF
jgi:hypothetical protein